MKPSNEPVAIGGALTALATAAIPVLRAFGVEVTEDQSTASLTFLAALIAFGTLVVRSRVTPVNRAQDKIDEAYLIQSASKPKPVL